MQCAGLHVRPSTYRDILLSDVPTGLPNACPIVYEWSSYKIAYDLYWISCSCYKMKRVRN